MTRHITSGPWCVPTGSGNEHVVCQGDDPHHPVRILFVLRHPMGTSNLIPGDEIGAAAQLAAEAGTVFHETGLTPQQMRDALAETREDYRRMVTAANRYREQRDELLAAVKLALTVIGGNAARDALVAALAKVEGRS